MIHLRCDNCGQTFNVPEAHANRTARCPKCNRMVTVTAAPATDPAEKQEDPEAPRTRSVDPAHDATFLDLATKTQATDEEPSQPDASSQDAEHAALKKIDRADVPKRPLPVEIILYPLDAIGLIHLVGLWLLLFYLCPLAVRLFGLGMEYVPIVYTLPVAYAVYYLTECVRGTAGGNRHVPDYWLHPSDSSRWDCLAQALDVLGCVALCFWPVSLYYGLEQRTDWVYWSLLAGGGFFFPMILLAEVLHDSLSALNPILIVGSIRRTFVPYCGMILLFYGGALLFAQMGFRLYIFQRPPILPVLLRLVQLYMIFVAIALLGRFYQRYKDKLDWGF